MKNYLKSKFLKKKLFLRIIFFSIFLTTTSAFAIDPSPETGGPVLTVDNQTDFRLSLSKVSTRELIYTPLKGFSFSPKESNFYSDDWLCPLAPIEPHSIKPVEFFCLQKYWFGAFWSTTVTGTLTIKAINENGTDAWPKGEQITVTLQTEKKNNEERVITKYSGTIDPFFEEDRDAGHERTPRINWTLTWNKKDNNGWKITLKQLKGGVDTGAIKTGNRDEL